MNAAWFALLLIVGIALVAVGGTNLDRGAEVIVCVTTPCPPQGKDPVWPELLFGSGIGLLSISAYLAYRLR